MLLGIVSIAVALLAGVRAADHGPAGFADVEDLMRAGAVPDATIERVVRTARSRSYPPATLCRWAAEHGAGALVLVIDAGVAEQALRDHLAAGTAPDWRALSVFAEIVAEERMAGMAAEERTDPDAVPLISDLLLLAELYDWSTAPPPEPGARPSRPVASWDLIDGRDWPDRA
jgi:hypothetical protein